MLRKPEKCNSKSRMCGMKGYADIINEFGGNHILLIMQKY